MTLLDDIELEDIDGEPASDPGPPHLRPWLTAIVLALCGLLILAHFGCHGDEDNELFSVVRSSWSTGLNH